MLKQSVDKLIKKQNLTPEESLGSLHEMLMEENSYLTAAFLALMKAKGETVDEVLGMIQGLKSSMVKVPVRQSVLDIVGTGGDGANTLNISTGSAILAAACGAKIAKHGNRSVSSRCGSADILEELGIALAMSPDAIADCIEKVGIGFMFAPLFHPTLKVLSNVRSGLQMRTIFNLMGPLMNPAEAPYRMIGVSSEDLLDLMAQAAYRMGTAHTLVFHGCGIDELSCLGTAHVREVDPSGIRAWTLDPEKLGLPRCKLDDLKGGHAKENAERLMEAFEGHEDAFFYTLALNSGVALWLTGKADSIEAGIEASLSNLKQGHAKKKLQQWKEQCQIS